ncbi:MAG: hypothetical protein CfP315_0297 [Candidatus Improbicoccus pseudotrichonymphae]|uniref:Uncharacterized protein n=1 Tax=Candidatus Improbicoccus pseudotrichonymphae TaxID=3033792 RepID=A0AA48L0S6_9FIRM|nr:MAG: hypothetical protein CfP315_0297 [Candidatus Improbicoccus pseudotrichonymphae]
MKPKETCGSKLSPAETNSPLNSVAFKMLRIILFDSKIQNAIINLSVFSLIYILISGGKVMKNKFIKSLVRKEKISNSENNKKTSKNNKIISSILAITMCCQPLVGAVAPDSQLVDSKKIGSKETVEITEDKDEDVVEILEDKNDAKKNDEDKNENESKKGDAVDKSKWFSSLAKTIAVVGVSGAIILGSYYIYMINRVKIGNRSYLTHSIGEENGNGFENLAVGMRSCEGIYEFRNKITSVTSKTLLQVKVEPDYENKIGDLSSYSEFIVEITKGKESFLSYLKNKGVDPTISGIVTHACGLLKKLKDPKFCLVNACVRVEIEGEGGGVIFFLISKELAPYLKV